MSTIRSAPRGFVQAIAEDQTIYGALYRCEVNSLIAATRRRLLLAGTGFCQRLQQGEVGQQGDVSEGQLLGAATTHTVGQYRRSMHRNGQQDSVHSRVNLHQQKR